MSGIQFIRRSNDAVERVQPVYTARYPFQTFKCVGPALFRSQAARDYACVLDLQVEIANWVCCTTPIENPETSEVHFVDLVAENSAGKMLIDVRLSGTAEPPTWCRQVAKEIGCIYTLVNFTEPGLEQKAANARELAVYARYRARLGDRIRLIAALQDAGSMTIAECLSCVREGSPMPTVAALMFAGFLEAELESAPLGPETQVRAIRMGGRLDA